MTHRVGALLVAVLLGTATMAAAPAWADPRRASGPPPSVFPAPRDQWRSWGVHTELPRHVPAPRQHHHGHHGHHGYHGRQFGHQGHVPPAVWVPGQWAWDGYYSQWVWSPGFWRRH